MPRFLTPEWVAAFDAALAGATLPRLGAEAGLTAAGGRFTVREEVRGGPDGDVVVTLRAEDGALRASWSRPDEPAGDGPSPDVTVILSYQDARDLAAGTLTPATALAEGRIKVRGDLSVLVAGQALLAAAQPALQPVAAATTY
ncbi:MAG: SCP2 sterol-binding domain-containing protein [Acidimicrobiales bacterium]